MQKERLIQQCKLSGLTVHQIKGLANIIVATPMFLSRVRVFSEDSEVEAGLLSQLLNETVSFQYNMEDGVNKLIATSTRHLSRYWFYLLCSIGSETQLNEFLKRVEILKATIIGLKPFSLKKLSHQNKETNESSKKIDSEELSSSSSGGLFVPEKMRKYIKNLSLENIASTTAMIHLGNSGDKFKEGDFENAGYLLFGPNTGAIIPVARSDEHHGGYDLCEYLMRKKLIPKDDYKSLWLLGKNISYIYHYEDAKTIQKALRKWVELGGPSDGCYIQYVNSM
jgi:hypothetical protein